MLKSAFLVPVDDDDDDDEDDFPQNRLESYRDLGWRLSLPLFHGRRVERRSESTKWSAQKVCTRRR
jgi:hypothetical protein